MPDIGKVFEAAKKKEELLQEQVKIEDGHIVINVNYEYNIALNRVDTSEKILWWVIHLSEKTWMTTEILRRFVHLSCAHHGIKLSQ